jgi:hypothetical protein
MVESEDCSRPSRERTTLLRLVKYSLHIHQGRARNHYAKSQETQSHSRQAVYAIWFDSPRNSCQLGDDSRHSFTCDKLHVQYSNLLCRSAPTCTKELSLFLLAFLLQNWVRTFVIAFVDSSCSFISNRTCRGTGVKSRYRNAYALAS